MITLNDRYIKPTKKEIAEVKRLNEMFFENDHNLLRGGKIKKKDKDSIDSLYYKFFHGIDNHDWSGSIIDAELENLKKDGICRNNSNKTPWSKSIVLNWYVDFPKKIDASYLFQCLRARESNTRMIAYFYSERTK